MILYKILLPRQWDAFDTSGVLTGSPLDAQSGFVHCSSRAQVAATLGRFFSNESEVVVVGFDSDDFGEQLRWEPAANDELFPHVYGPLLRSAVIEVDHVDLPSGAEQFLDGG